MLEGKRPQDAAAARPAVKPCPWCGGLLAFTRAFPVMRLAPGESRPVRDDHIPEAFRTVAAWTCRTPLCRYRESASLSQ